MNALLYIINGAVSATIVGAAAVMMYRRHHQKTMLDARFEGMRAGVDHCQPIINSMAKRAEKAENEAARLRTSLRASAITIDCMVARLNDAELEAKHLRVLAGLEQEGVE